MTKLRLLIKIVSITIITIFMMVCIIAGAFLLIYHFDIDVPVAIGEKIFYCYDFGRDLYAAVRYYCWPAPPTDSWVKCEKVKYVQRYLRNEKIQKIVLGKGEFVGPEKIKQVLHLISTAKKELSIVYPYWGRMVIVTDKHKFIIPINFGYQTINGLDWTSEELHKQLWEWGYGPEYKYDLPSKEQTVAILIYPPDFRYYRFENPLVVFGNKELAEEILFGIWIKDREGKTIRLNKYAKELKPKKVFEGRAWLEKIMDAYEAALKEAKERERYYPGDIDVYDGRIEFVTQDWDYVKEIGIDANAVFDDYVKSERLKKFFDELGITNELLAGDPNAVRHHHVDKVSQN